MDDELFLTVVFFAICYLIVVSVPKPKMAPKAVDLTFGPGRYTVDDDIPEGKYDLTATEGSGDFCILEKDADDWGFSNSLCAIFPDPASRFRNISLKKGDTLEINCNVTVSVTNASAIEDVEKEILSPGIYRFGSDIPEGKYSLEAVEGSGYVFTRDPKEEDKTKYEFFQFMAKHHQEKAPSFSNVKCEKDHELWVMGHLRLKLIKV